MGKKVLWAITGAGHFLEGTVAAMEAVCAAGITVQPVLSIQGELVVGMYRLRERVHWGPFLEPVVEKGPSHPALIKALYTGEFDAFIVAPASANTVAKVVCGIADTLITNLIAQGIKCGTHVHVLPTDLTEGVVETPLSSGEMATLTMRPVDLKNTRTLSEMMGISVLTSPEGISRVVDGLGGQQRGVGEAHLNME